MLDPFQPEKEEDVDRLRKLLAQLHETFIAYVQSRRGDKLAKNPDLFTGEVWLGQSAIAEGLADGIGHLVPVMKKRFGKKVRFRRYEARRPLIQRFGAQVVQDAIAGVEERAEYARFGL
jgi:serine protease SohB